MRVLQYLSVQVDPCSFPPSEKSHVRRNVFLTCARTSIACALCANGHGPRVRVPTLFVRGEIAMLFPRRLQRHGRLHVLEPVRLHRQCRKRLRALFTSLVRTQLRLPRSGCAPSLEEVRPNDPTSILESIMEMDSIVWEGTLARLS